MEERYGKYIGGAGQIFPPWGLSVLASILRKEGYNVMLQDCEALRYDFDKACREILKFEPDIVGISAVTISINNSATLAKMLKDINKNIRILIGGAHISGIPRKTMEYFPAFDIGVICEAEETIIELVENISDKNEYKHIKGIIYRDNGELVITEPRQVTRNLDSLPFPAYDLLPYIPKYYKPLAFSFKRLPCISLVSSRGCYGQCTFCDRTVSGKKMRFHSAEYIVEFITKMVNDYGAKEINFLDDLFVANKKRLYDFKELIKKKDLDIVWTGNGRIDSISQENLKIMKETNCWLMSYGIESGSQEVLDSIKKNITLEQIRRVIDWTKKEKIEIKGFFMLGHLQETKETLKKTQDFIMSLPIDYLSITVLSPLPNTFDYENADKYGTFNNDWRLLNQRVEVFVPHDFESNELQEALKKTLVRFYFKPKAAFTYIKKIFSYQRAKLIFKGFFSFLLYIFFSKYDHKKMEKQG